MTSPCVASSMDLPLTSRISSPTSKSALSAGEPETKKKTGLPHQSAMKKGLCLLAWTYDPGAVSFSYKIFNHFQPARARAHPTLVHTVEFNFLIFRLDQDDDIATQVHHTFVSVLHLGDSMSSSSGLSVPAVMVSTAQHTKTRVGKTREQFVARGSYFKRQVLLSAQVLITP